MLHIRGILILFLLLSGCATKNAEWGTSEELSEFQNSFFLKRAVNSRMCLGKQHGTHYYWDLYPKIRKVHKIGAIVHPNIKSIRRKPWHHNGHHTISISILPYIITDSGKRFYLLPEVANRMTRVTKTEPTYYPACQANSYLLAFPYPKFYPSVLLNVENSSDLNKLEQGLKKSLSKRKLLEFTSHPIALQSAMGMDSLLQTILQQKQAKFLDIYDFTIEVKMEGSKKGSITFKTGERLQNAEKPKQPSKPIDHKLIVISLSNSRELISKARAIQNSFITVLSELKQNNSKTPFTLLTVQSGRKLYKLLTSNELQSLPIEGDNSLLSRIELTINFGARDLKALADLSLVDSILQEQPSIGSILYLTDNTRMSKNPQNIPSQQLGVPLVWHKEGIALTVLTIKDCKIWEYMDTKCVVWKDKTDLIRELKAFLDKVSEEE